MPYYLVLSADSACLWEHQRPKDPGLHCLPSKDVPSSGENRKPHQHDNVWQTQGCNRWTARLELQFSHSVMSDSLRLHGPQLPCGGWMASVSTSNSWSLLKQKSIELVMPFNHLILCYPLLFLPSIFPSIRVFSNQSVLCIRWPKY